MSRCFCQKKKKNLFFLLLCVSSLLVCAGCSNMGSQPLSFKPDYDDEDHFVPMRRIAKDPSLGKMRLRSERVYHPLKDSYASRSGKKYETKEPVFLTSSTEVFSLLPEVPEVFEKTSFCAYSINDLYESRNAFSPDEKQVLKAFGTPGFEREFVSCREERIQEWLYPRQKVIMQFSEGSLIFAGPMAERNKILLEKGRPHYTVQSDIKDGPRHTTFIYSDHGGKVAHVYCFEADGTIIDRVR
jgi:hypothetical protein